MNEKILFLLIKISFIVLIVLWSSIVYRLIYRKLRTRSLLEIESKFADIISSYLYSEKFTEKSLSKISGSFQKIGITKSKPENVQFLINLMIRTQRSLLGRNHEKLKELYKSIPPYDTSYNKTLKKDWYIKACGIREIYEMNQSQFVSHIAKFKNDPNIFVRREAQIALVVFLGWESLRFLPYLSRRMELWQQIKIVEKLHNLYPEPKVSYIQNAYKIKNDYGRELIMRIIRKFNIVEEMDFIISHLSHSSVGVRETALYCLSSFHLNSEQLERIKTVFYELNNLKHQQQLLYLIQKSSPVIDISFYRGILNGTNDMLQLKAAEILWNNGYLDIVQQFYLDQYKVPAREEL